MMSLKPFFPEDRDAVRKMFRSSFAKAEGEAEGDALSQLIADIARDSRTANVCGFVAWADESVAGAIFFSEMDFGDEDRVMLLSPVAVAKAHQRQGVGLSLIHHGIAAMKTAGVAEVMTYGDPAYYGRFGFQSVSEAMRRAPYTLSQPQGWLALALSGPELKIRSAQACCMPAFNNPGYW